ncbi:hypothetical protein [Saccharothrix xinjiangensis]|uniref:Uncharacterized protein n=1 Tax=Saccharothrix xinjiangensis TaxID=204798 RepID=A0ABV9YI93_9PSEU
MTWSRHSAATWRDFPEPAAGVVFADGITPDHAVPAATAPRFDFSTRTGEGAGLGGA